MKIELAILCSAIIVYLIRVVFCAAMHIRIIETLVKPHVETTNSRDAVDWYETVLSDYTKQVFFIWIPLRIKYWVSETEIHALKNGLPL